MFHLILAVGKLRKRKKLQSTELSYVEQCKVTSDLYLPIKKKYDIAISYHAPGTIPVFYVMDKINADKKILWLHGDLDFNAGTSVLLQKYHSKYDKVFAVSESVRNSFLKYHMDMEKRTELFYNYIDVIDIREKANEGMTFLDTFEGIRILSVGRLDVVKGFDVAIQVCKHLITDGYNVQWYVLGEGNERENLEQLIRDNELEGKFILLGNKNNPYGYIKNCDLFMQTSRHEGFGLALNEARTLYKPIITTDVAGAREQIEDGITGWIVPHDLRKIVERTEWCLDHMEQLEIVSENLRHAKVQWDEPINKLFS